MKSFAAIAYALLATCWPRQDATAETISALTSVQVVSNVPFRRQVAAAAALDVHVVRFGIRWHDVEKKKGHRDWRSVDAKMRLLDQENIVPIVTLFGDNPAYAADTTGAGKAPPASGDALRGYADFAASAVERYGVGTRGRPVIYEIWNEPNTKTFWSRPPDPEAYATMAAAACRAIKAENPDATVLGLAMEGTPVKAPYYVLAYGLDIYRDWANRAATPPLMRCVDGISMHPYRAVPETYLIDEPALQRFVTRHWAKAAPPVIANTEWGYAINARKGKTATAQASLDIRALLLGVGMGRPTNLYQIVDGGPDADDPNQNYGLFSHDGRIKPAGAAIQRLLKRIGDFEIDGVAAVFGRDDIFRFRAHKRAVRAEIWWKPDSGAPVGLDDPPPGEQIEAIDLISGKPRAVRRGTLIVDSAPVLVIRSRP